MGKAVEYLKKSDIKFIIADSGLMRYSRVSDKKKVLCTAINRGYFETKDSKAIEYLREFIKRGNMRDVKLRGYMRGSVVEGEMIFRQEVFFSSLDTLFRMLKNLEMGAKVLKSFEVTKNDFNYCTGALKEINYNILKSYKRITLGVLYQLNILGVLIGVDVELEGVNFRKEDYNSLLNFTPYIVTKYNPSSNVSAIFLPPESFLVKEEVPLVTNKPYKESGIELYGLVRGGV